MLANCREGNFTALFTCHVFGDGHLVSECLFDEQFGALEMLFCANADSA